ncbi:hypothetical protein COU36_02170 [Candidatus Micrarchaeota archaeon CG10_big_fil_rev_8_21_14_0_10_59_7]|nr:MAG: hypothetical protein COU36_02170 [Candidatus Micrarchaeota archaeon CG10_big_fil_rev_8_21_14_0_10_59_7]
MFGLASTRSRNNAAKGANTAYKGALKAALDLPLIKPLKPAHKIRLNQALFVYGYLSSEQLGSKLRTLDFMSQPRINAVTNWHVKVTPRLQALRSNRPT